MDDPQITGYILPLAEGCRVHVRIRVAEYVEIDARFGTFALIVVGVMFLFFRGPPKNPG